MTVKLAAVGRVALVSDRNFGRMRLFYDIFEVSDIFCNHILILLGIFFNGLKYKELNYKILNFREVLMQSEFHHENVKTDFSLKNVYESVFPEKKLFEHSRIILNAFSDNPLDKQLINSDLELENKALRDIFRKVINIL